MTELSLSGQTALVTGGARRIGAAIVQSPHAAGAKVVIYYHQSQNEAAALAAIESTTRQFCIFSSGRFIANRFIRYDAASIGL